jgi:hypothetical protein
MPRLLLSQREVSSLVICAGDRTEASASSKLLGVYIGPLIRHCLRGKRGPRVQALRVPYSHGYSRAPTPPRLTHNLWSLLHFRGDYCAPGCRLLSSCYAKPAKTKPTKMR